jgi:hypothetical protein
MTIPQTTIAFLAPLGVPGERFDDSPSRAQSYIINSASAANNVFARGFSITGEGTAAAGNTTADKIFAGILVNPKQHYSLGTSSGTLNPSLTLPNNVQGDLATMGSYIVTLLNTAVIGNEVIMRNTDGVLDSIAPGVALPVGWSPAYATVSYFTATPAGLAVITLTPTLQIPVLA